MACAMLALGLHLSSSDDQCSERAHYLLVPPCRELCVLSWCLFEMSTVFVLKFPFQGHHCFSSGFASGYFKGSYMR